MAQMLIRMKDNTNKDPEKDLGCYKRGMPVCVMPDDHIWGKLEGPPDFCVMKFPKIPVEEVKKYMESQYDGIDKDGIPIFVRRRVWQVRVDDLPLVEKEKVEVIGEITVKATTDYKESYDSTWDTIKTYFRNLETNLDEVKEIDPKLIDPVVDPIVDPIDGGIIKK